MKFRYFSIFVATIISLMTINSCHEVAPVPVDPVISVDKEIFEAGPELTAIKVAVSANCDWVVVKEDYDGNSISWIQSDIQKGSGDATLGIRVLENRITEERKGQVIIMAAGAKAFIDVVQAAGEPKPVPPVPPEPTGTTIKFDFTVDGLNWPLNKETPWSNFTNMDSGLALDNGGTPTENTHRRVQCAYTVDGVEYFFTIADPDGVANHNIYLSSGKGVYSGTYRYLGLPAIEGKKLTKIVMVQGASDKNPETFKRNVGITPNIYSFVTAADVEKIEYIAGGEPQNQYSNMGTYEYNLTDTQANTVYYMVSPTNASIIVNMELTYEGCDTPVPGPDQLDLTFSFEQGLDPQPGWPLATTDWPSGMGNQKTCYYTLDDGNQYEFKLIEPPFAQGGKIYWNADKGGFFIGMYRYLGFPVISGYVLKTVECTVCVVVDGKLAILDNIYNPGSPAHPESYVADPQSWNVPIGTVITYEVNSTDPDKQYYLYCISPNGGDRVGEITLRYSKK